MYVELINNYTRIIGTYNMHDVLDIIQNVDNIYGSNTSFNVLKDFEKVLDELDLYVYKNWEDGEIVEGPKIERHWITCSFMWDKKNMPDPMGGKRLLDYDCKVRYKKDTLIVPRKITNPDDIRPGSKKGKLDRKPVWIVEIQMPKKLIIDIVGEIDTSSYAEQPANAAETQAAAEAQPADQAVAEPAAADQAAAPEATAQETI
jgi:hypothetical protein